MDELEPIEYVTCEVCGQVFIIDKGADITICADCEDKGYTKELLEEMDS